MVSIGLGRLERREAETTTERIHQFVYQRTYTSGAIVVAIIAGFFFGIVPLGVFSLLPDAFSKLVLLMFVANVIAFLPARSLHNRYKSLPVDYIFDVNAERQERGKVWMYYEGMFKEDFEIDGSLDVWRSYNGKNVYLVNHVDPEEQAAKASHVGEKNDIELLQFEESVKQNRLRNRVYARAGMKLLASFQGMADRAKTEYFQAFVKRGMEYAGYDTERILSEVKEEIPEFDEEVEDTDDDVKDLLKDLSNAGLEAEVSLQNEEENENGDVNG